MTAKPVHQLPVFAASRAAIALAALVIVLAGLAAYLNSFSAPFVFDDEPAITDNASIRDLTALPTVLGRHDTGSSVAGRPVVNLSFALNYAIDGTDVRGYHVFNLVVHLLAGLTLFGIARRTAATWIGGAPNATRDALLAGSTLALWWVVHPLQTESVTFVVQRTESLVSLWLLVTLYGFIRGAAVDSGSRARLWWFGVSATACMLGMATKEVMVVAPLIVLLYDRTFVSGTFAAAWHRHARFHLFLVATWVLLAYFVVNAGHTRTGVTDAGAAVSPWHYLLTQCRAIVHYLRLAIWPEPLVVDYGTAVVTSVGDVLPQAIFLTALFSGVLLAVWRWPRVGFVGVCFFAILAPSSSVVPLPTQTMAEHRMYLPLACVLALVVAGAQRVAWRQRLLCALTLAGVYGWLTVRRNEDYRSGVALWLDTVRKVPENARAHYNLANCLVDAGRPVEALAEFETTLRLRPDYAVAENNLGSLLDQMGRTLEALAHYETALRLDPGHVQAHVNLGHALLKAGRFPEAIAHYETALRLDPKLALVHVYWGTALMQERQPAQAVPHFEQAVQLEPALLQARAGYAAALTQLGRLDEAIAQSEAAVWVKPDSPDAHVFLANCLLRAGRRVEARQEFEAALQLAPDHAGARDGLVRVGGGK